jgi:hypothetical protein
MSEDEKIEWYDAVCGLLEEEPIDGPVHTMAFYWADCIWMNMDYITKRIARTLEW